MFSTNLKRLRFRPHVVGKIFLLTEIENIKQIDLVLSLFRHLSFSFSWLFGLLMFAPKKKVLFFLRKTPTAAAKT